MNEPEDYYDEFDDESVLLDTCPKCGRWYDEIGKEYQYCRACGWDAEENKYGKPIKPTRSDYEMGEADILTGRWY